MTLEKNEKLTILRASDGYNLKSKLDIYKPSYIDEEGNKIEEHIPYYFEMAYVPDSMTLDKAKELYEEVKVESEVTE